MINECDLEVTFIPRALVAPVYRWRAAGMMLTDEDLFLVLSVSLLEWFAITSFGLGEKGYGVITLDPYGVMLTAVILIYAITLFHWLKPDDSLLWFLRNGSEAKVLAAWCPQGDALWSPSPIRRIEQ